MADRPEAENMHRFLIEHPSGRAPSRFASGAYVLFYEETDGWSINACPGAYVLFYEETDGWSINACPGPLVGVLRVALGTMLKAAGASEVEVDILSATLEVLSKYERKHGGIT